MVGRLTDPPLRIQAGDVITVQNDPLLIKAVELRIAAEKLTWSGKLDLRTGQWVITVLRG